MKRNVILLFSFVVLAFGSVAGHTQAPNTAWLREYCESYQDGPGHALATSDGGWVLCGARRSSFELENDAFIRKLDSRGDIVWTNLVGGDDTDVFVDQVELADGSFVFAGGTASYGGPYGAAYVVKTTANGLPAWTCVYSGSRSAGASTVALAPNGGVAFAGNCWADPTGSLNLYLVVLDAQGRVLTEKTYRAGNVTTSWITDLVPCRNGGWLLTGYRFTAHPDTLQEPVNGGWLIRIGENGDTLWTKALSNPAMIPYFAHSLLTSELIIGGQEDEHIAYLKLDAQGQTINYTLPPTGEMNLRSTYGRAFDDGSMIFGGQDDAFWEPGNSVLYATDSNGDSLWWRRDFEFLNDITGSDVAGDPERGLLWLCTKTVFDPPDTCLYHGYYVRLKGTDESVGVADNFGAVECYPNPFNGTTTIQFESFVSGPLTLEVFDLLGRRCFWEEVGSVIAGQQQISISLSNSAAGKYFGRLSLGSTSRTVPMIILR